MARATLENFAARAFRLYEQERGRQGGFPRFGEYVRRWSGWVRAGLPTGAVRGGSGLGHSSLVAGATFPLVASPALGSGGFLDVEVE